MKLPMKINNIHFHRYSNQLDGQGSVLGRNKKFLSSPQRPTGSGPQQASYPMGNWFFSSLR
jgi:hypothetical protein